MHDLLVCNSARADLESPQGGGAILEIWSFQYDQWLFRLGLIFIAGQVNANSFTLNLV